MGKYKPRWHPDFDGKTPPCAPTGGTQCPCLERTGVVGATATCVRWMMLRPRSRSCSRCRSPPIEPGSFTPPRSPTVLSKSSGLLFRPIASSGFGALGSAIGLRPIDAFDLRLQDPGVILNYYEHPTHTDAADGSRYSAW
jgi:hypothetical protein